MAVMGRVVLDQEESDFITRKRSVCARGGPDPIHGVILAVATHRKRQLRPQLTLEVFR